MNVGHLSIFLRIVLVGEVVVCVFVLGGEHIVVYVGQNLIY